MTKEKKKTIIFTVVLAVIVAILLVAFVIIELKQNGTIASKEVNEVMEEFNEEFNSKEKTIIYYASSSCSYCELQTPILETIAEDYDLDYYYIDSSTLGTKQRNEILEKLEIEHATPTTVIVQNGKVVDTAVGYTEGRAYVEFFKENGLVSEDAVYSAEQYITFVDYSEYEEIINDDKTNIVVIGQTTCSHCIAMKPAINTVAGEYDLTIYYLNITELTEEESNKFTDSLTTIEYNDPDFVESGSFGTPLTLIIENGKVKDYISGARTVSQLTRELTKMGIITE